MADDVQPELTTAPFGRRLCNFVTGQAQPLPAHEEFARGELKTLLKDNAGAFIDLLGFASRLGFATGGDSNQKNVELSKRRIAAVKQMILRHNPGIRFNIEDPKGSSDDQGPRDDNDGFFRAVLVKVFGVKRPNVPPPPPSQPTARRIVHRQFQKIETTNFISGPSEDNAKDITATLKALTGLDSPLEERGARRIGEFPSNHRVNRVRINLRVTLDVFSAGAMLTTEFTDLDYEWGPSLPNVTIEQRFQATVLGEQKPAHTETKFLPRAAAESTPLIVPPDP